MNVFSVSNVRNVKDLVFEITSIESFADGLVKPDPRLHQILILEVVQHERGVVFVV